MTVWIRIFMYIVAGWLMSSGLINEEVRQLLTTDPDVAAAIQVALAAVLAAANVIWWRLAKRFGWKT